MSLFHCLYGGLFFISVGIRWRVPFQLLEMSLLFSGDVPTDAFLDGYCSTVQRLLDWFEVDLRFPELVLCRFICVLSV